MEANDPSLKTKIVQVIAAKFLGEELLPPIAFLGVGGMSIFLLQWGDVGVVLLVSGVDASRGGKQEALDAVQTGRLQHVSVDEDIVAGDFGELGGNIADAAHVGGEIVDLIHVTGGLESVVPEAEIEQFKLIGRGGFEFRLFDVDATNPVDLPP